MMTYLTHFGIGLIKSGGQWKWSDGSLATWTKWAAGQPNNLHNPEHCVILHANGFEDDQCTRNVYFICEVIEGDSCL